MTARQADTPPPPPLVENGSAPISPEKYRGEFSFSESGVEADSRRVNVLLGADGVVRTPARLAGWVRSLVVAGLADIRRSGRGGGLGADVLDFLDALQSAELSENGRIVGDVGRIVIGDVKDRMLTSSQAAELLECDARTVRRAFDSGRLRGRKLGHEWVTTREDLDDFRFGKKGRNGKRTDAGE